jgi:hypothetical protein
MNRTHHATDYARISAAVFILLAIVTFLIAATGEAQAIFVGKLHRSYTLLVGLMFLVPGVGMLLRKTWAWYTGLLVITGFTAAGLVQIVIQQRIGFATLLVGITTFYCVTRASAFFSDAIYPIVPEGTSDAGDHRVIGGPAHGY